MSDKFGVPVSDTHFHEVTGEPFKLGAIPTPKHRLEGAKSFQSELRAALPEFVAYVPSKLDMWGNDQYGDCVSAEEAYAKACCGIFIDASTVIDWARRGGFLNGAMLDEVLDAMRRDGFHSAGHVYGVGEKQTVDYQNPETLKAALTLGPVKIAIDHRALPSGAGNRSGWYSLGGGNFGSTDHCVAIGGYGKAANLYKALGLELPAGLDPQQDGYLLYTWKTLGFVTQKWLNGTCVEAWLRLPTTTVDGKPQPQPGPGPDPKPPTPPTPPTPPVPPTPTPSNGLPVWAVVAIGVGLVAVGLAVGLLVKKN